jgi:hypothetical protein
VAGAARSKADRDPAGWWTVDTTHEALIEFLDDPGVEAFTLTCQVREEKTSGIPVAGLFTSHRQVPDAAGDWHLQLEYSYREALGNYLASSVPKPRLPPGPGVKQYTPILVRPKGGNPDGTLVTRLNASRFNDHGDRPSNLHERTFQTDKPVDGGPWRTLEIRIDGATFSTAWDGQPVLAGQRIADEKVKHLAELFPDGLTPPLRFPGRGGLGVYVEGGAASFRDLVIVPTTSP